MLLETSDEGFFKKIGFQDYDNYKTGRYYVVDSELEEDLLKLIKSDQKIFKYLDNKAIKKKIYIKNKLLNIII